MRWARHLVGAAALTALAGAGCVWSGNFLAFTPGKPCMSWVKPVNGDRVVAASVESVSESTQASLRKLGLSAIVTEKGEDVRIASKTRSGAEFAFVLTRVKSEDGAQTRVHLEWEKGAGGKNAASVVQILADLELEKGKPTARAK